MSNSISVINNNVIAKVSKNGLSSVLKPLTKEINLFQCNLDFTEQTKPSTLKQLKLSEKLALKIDKDNIFDSSAVGVYDASNNRIGYIPSWFSPIPKNLIKRKNFTLQNAKIGYT